MAFGKPKQPKEPKAPKKTEATDNSIKEQKLPKSNRKVKNPRKLAEKFEQELPEVARRLGIRVSSPYGYYPEDVDRIILDLEESGKKKISNSKTTIRLQDKTSWICKRSSTNSKCRCPLWNSPMLQWSRLLQFSTEHPLWVEMLRQVRLAHPPLRQRKLLLL